MTKRESGYALGGKHARVGLILVVLCWSGWAAQAVEFTSNTTIAADDLQYDGQPIVVNGCIVTINGGHTFESLQIINGGIVTHSPNSDAQTNWLDLTITQDALIDAGSAIDVSGRGYTQNNGPGTGSSCASGSGGGAAHGGNGGRSSGALGGCAYGVLATPMTLGSGGGSGHVNCNGGAGGGAVRLWVGGTLLVDGALRAAGHDGTTGYYNKGGGGGAGGSIYLHAQTVAGGGMISATGGAHGGTVGESAGGGGGRIAVHADSNTFAGTLTAAGGDGDYETGGAGTIYMHNDGGVSAVLIHNADQTNAALTPQMSNAPHAFTVLGGAVFYTPPNVTLGALTVGSGGRVTNPPEADRTELAIAGDLVVAAGGTIDVTGLGYASEAGPGAGLHEWRGSGAGHGGRGGASDTIDGGADYDDALNPAQPGSGGGGGGTVLGGSGGGVFLAEVGGSFVVDGAIMADARPGQTGGYNSAGGGGSGGSIRVSCTDFAGSGLLSANGAPGGHLLAGGGAGGRIAVFFAGSTFAGALEAHAGSSDQQPGGAGTIYLKPQADLGHLIIDNASLVNSAHTPLGESGPYTLVIAHGANVYTSDQLVIGGLDVAAGGRLTHLVGGPTLDLDVQTDVIVRAGGLLDVTGCGHGSAAGPGAGSGEWRGGGGGHGGVGGSSDLVLGGGIYDAVNHPLALGSGGGWGYSPTQLLGGHGGGAIRIVAGGALTVDGEIRADGVPGQVGAYFTAAGAGSGGSIYLTAGAIGGAGLISAAGGDGHVFVGYDCGAGGGGGGRIALYSCNWDLADLTISVAAGEGHLPGGPGSLLLGSESISITQEPVDLVGFQGRPLDITIIAESSTGNVTYAWRKDGVLLENDGHYSGVDTAVLHIDAVVPTDVGLYDVMLSDDCGGLVSAAAELDIARLGDLNCDGALTWRDIDPFVAALSGQAAYEAAYPECHWIAADCNGDGGVSWRDIDPFVALLSAPPGAR